MSSAVQKLAVVDGSDRSAAFDAIADAVWAVTIVDAALVRYHPGAYDDLLAAATPTDRELVERTLAGVRFVRNQIAGQAEVASFVAPPAVDPVAGGGLMDWTWRPVSEPEHIGRAPRARSWETSRYRGYHSALAGHTVKEIFARAEEFLLGAAANAGLITEVAVRGTSPGLLPGVREG